MTTSRHDRLIADAKAGDERAQEQLFEAAAERVLLYLRLRMGDALRRERESLDVLQEAFVVAQQNLASSEVEDLGSYLTWLCRIAENRLLRHAQHDRAQKRRPPGEREAFSAVIDRLRDGQTGPQTAALREERRQRVIAALDTEPEDARRALLGRFFEGRTLDEIAAELGRSPTGVRRLLGESAIRLGSTLRDLGEQE
jgi:RNA polymerase sigma factor (sigma-70 family)